MSVLVTKVSKRLGNAWVLARVSFDIPPGSVALLVGPNGSGKTTLLRCLATVLSPDQGEVTLGGINVSDDRDKARGKIGVILNQGGSYADLSVRENLELLSALGLFASADIATALGRVGLEGRSHLRLRACSSGMKRRFELARSLLLDREIALLDEPEAHLDADGLSLLRDILAEWKKRGRTIVVASHAVDAFRELADTEIRLTAGRVEGSA